MEPTPISEGSQRNMAGRNKENHEDTRIDGELKREKRPLHIFKVISHINLQSGAKYEGEWLGQDRDGYGTQIWPDGAKYQGEWKKN